MRRQLNRKFLVVLVAAGVVLGAGIHVVHGLQVKRSARVLLKLSGESEEKGDLGQAAKHLERYLAYRPDDGEALAKYALTLEALARTDRARMQALATLERAVQRRPERDDLRRKAVRVAIELGQFSDARGHLNILLEKAESGTKGGQVPPSADYGELKQLAGQCEVGSKAYGEAAKSFRVAIEHAPHRIESYVLLAMLLRGQLDDDAGADRVIDDMVAKNEGSYQAHLERWRYRGQSRPSGDAKAVKPFLLAGRGDVERALQLAPDEADVLVAAAEAAQVADDLKQARRHLERGLEKHSKDARMYRLLAGLEFQEGRPDAAIRRLRDAIKAVPAAADALSLELADALIRADRPEEATKVIAQLRAEDRPAAPLDLLEARVRMGRKDYVGAIPVLEAARAALVSRAAPGGPAEQRLLAQADLLLGTCYGQIGAGDQELSAYQRVLQADPRSLPARLGVAAARLNSGRIDQAIQAYRQVVADFPEAQEYRVTVARLLLLKTLRAPAGQRRWGDVDRALDDAAKVASDGFGVSILRAEALAAQGHLDRARALLEEVRGEHADRAEPWIALAGLAERQGKPDEGLALLDEARKRLGDLMILRLARIRSWAHRGGDGAKQALAQLAAEVESAPQADRAQLLNALAIAFQQVGDPRQARQLWARQAQLRPDDLNVRTLLFDLALQDGDDAALQQVVEEMRKIEGDGGTLWRYGAAVRLVTAAERGDKQGLGRARALLTEVAGRRPSWSRVPLLEARIAELEGDPERAIEGYRRAIERGDSGARTVRQLVQLLYRRGRYEEADQVIHQMPQEVPLTGVLGQIAAELSLRNQDYGRALELAQRSVPADPTDHRDRIWLARVLAAAGRQDEAVKTLRRAAEAAGEAPEVWIALVQQLARMGRKADAEAAIREAQSKLPAERSAATLALCYEALGVGDRAESLYKDALKAKPGDTALLAKVADFYLRSLRLSQAEPYLRQLIDPHLKATATEAAWARRNLAIVLADRGSHVQFQEAMGLVEQNLRGGTTTEDLRAKGVVLATQRSHRREAIAALEEVGRREPPTPNDQFLLARLYAEDGDWPKSRRLMLALLAARGDDQNYLATFAGRLLDRGDTAEATPWVGKLERLDPRSYRTKELRARLLKARGKVDEAVALLKAAAREPGAPIGRIAAMLDGWGQAAAEEMYRALAARPGRPEVVLLLADFLARKGRVGEALDVCDGALRTCPADAVGSAYLTVLEAAPADERHVRRVERRLDEAIAAHPESGLLPVHLAVLRCKQGRYDEAEAIYRRQIERNGRNIPALNNLAWLLAQRGRGGDEALRLIDRAIEFAGPRPALLDTRAVACLALGRSDDAIRDLERAVAQIPDGNGYFHLAQAYQGANNRAAAVEALRKAKGLGVRPDPLEKAAYDRLLTQLDSR
jgi:cellulose synthase operon protein C